MIITIDGPTASGKSTMGRALAKSLGYYYVNSGLLYRGLAYLLITNKKYTLKNLASVHIPDVAEYLNSERFIYEYDPVYKEKISFDGIDITPYMGSSEIGNSASIVSTNLQVREEINNFMRILGKSFDLVVDGRDAGTVVFPNADMKFFLTASLAVRIKRWIKTQAQLGNFHTYNQAMEIILERDKRDREREVAPLTIPHDAIVIDNSSMNRSQTLSSLESFLISKIGDKIKIKNISKK